MFWCAVLWKWAGREKFLWKSKQGRCDGCLFVGVIGFSCLCQQKQSLLLRAALLAALLAEPDVIDKHNYY